MIYDPDQGIRVLKGNTWSLAGENPVTLLNEVTPIVAGGTGNSQLGGWLPNTFLGNQIGAWRSLVAHLFWVQGVACSNHVAPTISLGNENEQNRVFSNEIFQKKGKCQKNV